MRPSFAINAKSDRLGEAEEALVEHLPHADRNVVPVVAPHTPSVNLRLVLPSCMRVCLAELLPDALMESQGMLAWPDCGVTEISSIT